ADEIHSGLEFRRVLFRSNACRSWRRIQESCRMMIRKKGEPLPADATLMDGQGTCRDLTVLFNEACRSVGLAARFVSGYHAADSEIGRASCREGVAVCVSA